MAVEEEGRPCQPTQKRASEPNCGARGDALAWQDGHHCPPKKFEEEEQATFAIV